MDGESIGRPRGEVALHLLLELNPDVRGTFVDQAVDEILDNQPDFFSPFTCVIATCLPERFVYVILFLYLICGNLLLFI